VERKWGRSNIWRQTDQEFPHIERTGSRSTKILNKENHNTAYNKTVGKQSNKNEQLKPSKNKDTRMSSQLSLIALFSEGITVRRL
jgi:hypothetical protein